MKRNLLKQMGNEWRENIWHVLELLIVFLAIWMLLAIAFNSIGEYLLPRGFNPENVCFLEVKPLDAESPMYTDFGDEKDEKNGEDLLMLLNRIRKSPNVEAAGFSWNGRPYQFSYYGDMVCPEGDSVSNHVNTRMVSPDVAKVLEFESLNGLSAETIASLLAKREVLIGTSDEYNKVRDPRKLLGRPLYINNDSSTQYISHALIAPVRRSEFEDNRYGGTLVRPILDEDVASGRFTDVYEILVKMKPGKEKAFSKEFDDSPDMQKRRNIYLSKPVSLMTARKNVQRSNVMDLRMKTGLTLCLLAMVFLGLLGTFWFRVHKRESEIAIRKVNGATSGDIFRRLLSEGMLLMAMSGAIGVAIAAICIHSDLLPEGEELTRAYIASGMAAFVIVLAAVLAGISIPAKIAMRIEPAVALKDE